ncbi:MAG: AraC family transcriptional regulator [Spirosomataceae bacterium]
MSVIYHEITPLTQSDCFMVFDRHKSTFDFPVHYHEEYELNFIENARGAKRIIGDNIEVIQDFELVLVGANLPHGWLSNDSDEELRIHEITIQFHKDLFDDKFLRRNQLSFLRTLLERSSRGILFSQETIMAIKPRLIELSKKSGFDSVLELISILHDLSVSRNMRMLTSSSFVNENISYNSRRIETAFEFMRANYQREITLDEIAKMVNMAEVSFCRFIKKRTGKTFIDCLNDIRLGHASRLLIDTTFTVAEVSYKCGFNNLSYFNRVFKKKYNCTPKDFRQSYSGTKLFI